MSLPIPSGCGVTVTNHVGAAQNKKRKKHSQGNVGKRKRKQGEEEEKRECQGKRPPEKSDHLVCFCVFSHVTPYIGKL